jgi:hypothetical protein
MKNTPERLALEQYLRYEQAGSVKIHALANYAALKDVEYRIARFRDDEIDFDRLEVETRRVCIEYEIDRWKFTAEVEEYEEVFAEAGEILKLYYEMHENPGYEILDDLKEINWEKARYRAFIR